MQQWGIPPTSIFSRHAELESFLHLDEKTRDWLNGSIFELEHEALFSIGQSLFGRIAGVFSGDSVDGQLHLDFEAYDFSFIPIETLSVIYEQFLHVRKSDSTSSQAKNLGAYYTPIPLIAFMQEELEKRRPLVEDMKIMDPSCGSGAFLVQCYRRIIERQIKKKKSELSPTELRNILTTQIFGVDRDRDACRVAELSLILTLLDYIEPPDLQSNPNFRLPDLRNTNIFEADLFDPDSVCAGITATPTFDWIVGNPPWIELNRRRMGEENRHVWQWIQDHAADSPVGGRQVAEAFAWKVLDFLKPNGVAALVLPAMTLFKRESATFRKRFFTRAASWFVANFSNLADTLFSGRARQPAAVLFFQLLQRPNRTRRH